uniref:Uncharacterized protein n=1 Tax=Meloidogyne javanica TaxID=6303 RepID=A0A915LJS9_MELJA
MRQWISKFPEGVYTSDGKVIYCQACQQEAPSSQFSQLNQHNNTAKHVANYERFSARAKQKQPFLKLDSPDPLAAELCNVLVGANIPFSKLNNPVEEERLNNLLSSIGHLSAYGDVPVYAFSTLISTAPPQAIAEHLHQRWLADQNFSLIAPKIVYQMSDNVTVCSQVLSFALRDFNTRHDIRKQSRAMFRNFVCTLVELYPVYRKIDKCLSACLIDPLFRCLKMLVSEDPDDRDLHQML